MDTEFRESRKAKLNEELTIVLSLVNEIGVALGNVTQKVLNIQMELANLDEAEA